jgi:hypothetical protein
MATELHDLTVPVFLRGFKAMATFLEKARAHADEHGIAHDDLLTARLYDDMAPLTGRSSARATPPSSPPRASPESSRRRCPIPR